MTLLFMFLIAVLSAYGGFKVGARTVDEYYKHVLFHFLRTQEEGDRFVAAMNEVINEMEEA
jgi:hypothetical protein